MSKELKPCPFCGGNNTSIIKYHKDERCGYNIKAIASCDCGASVEVVSEEDSSGWCIESSASVSKRCKEKWNKRYEFI